MWVTKGKANLVPFFELGTILKFLSASPKNIVRTKNMELYMDDENIFRIKTKNDNDFKPYSPSIDELLSIVNELKEENLYQDIAIDVLYCEM